MFKHKPFRRLTAMAVSIVMVLTFAPMTVLAEEGPPALGASGKIIYFTPLDEEIEKQAVLVGGSIEEVYLPATLTATVQIATDPDTQKEMEIPVTWDCSPVFDGNQAGVYTFAPVVENYTVSAEPPQITVGVIAGMQTYASSTVAINQGQSVADIKSAIEAAIAAASSGGEITVTGAATNITGPLALTGIAKNIIINWDAELTSKPNADFNLITLSTTGGGRVIFRVNQGASISHSTDGSAAFAAILIEGDSSVSLSVNSASISASGVASVAIATRGTSDIAIKSDITINDGTVSAEGEISVAISSRDSTIRVLGGTVTARGENAVAIDAPHGVEVSNATIEAAGEQAAAIVAMDTIKVAQSTIIASGEEAVAISTIMSGGITVTDSTVIASGEGSTALYSGDDGITVTRSTIAAFGAGVARPEGSSAIFSGGVIHARDDISINSSAVFFRGGAEIDPHDFIRSQEGALDENAVIYVAWDETAFTAKYTAGPDIIFNGSGYDDMFMTILEGVGVSEEPAIYFAHVNDPHSRLNTIPGVFCYFQDDSGNSSYSAFPLTHIPNLRLNYNVTVYGDSGKTTVFGPYFPGETVTITAPPAPAGTSFVRWHDSNELLYKPGDPALTENTLTFTMPVHYYLLDVVFDKNDGSSSDGSSSDGSSSDGSSSDGSSSDGSSSDGSSSDSSSSDGSSSDGSSSDGSSSDSSSSDGSASVASTTTSWFTNSELSAIITAAKNNSAVFARRRSSGIAGVRAASFAALAGLEYQHDTVANNVIEARLYIKSPVLVTKDLLVSARTTGARVNSVKALFERWFSNKIVLVSFDQAGDWGQAVNVAARIDLSDMNTSNLVFYAYDSATNTYKRIAAPAYWIDANGYLRFTTPHAGDIIISEGALVKR